MRGITTRILMAGALCASSVVVCALLSEAQRGAGDAHRYEARGKRDPFVPLLGQGKASAVPGLADVITVDDIFLAGIARDGSGTARAFLNGELVGEGTVVGVVEIVAIEPKGVTLLVGGKEYTITLLDEEAGGV